MSQFLATESIGFPPTLKQNLCGVRKGRAPSSTTVRSILKLGEGAHVECHNFKGMITCQTNHHFTLTPRFDQAKL